MNLTNQVALITGAGSGIGAATARLMAQAGASVALAGIPAEPLHAVADALIAAGHAALALPTDVSDEEQVQRAVEKTVDYFGRLDIAVPNAGIQLHDEDVNLHSLPTEVWDRTHDVNYKGVYLTCKHALAQFMRQRETGDVADADNLAQSSVITIVASVTALNGRSANPAYLSGKHGLIGLNRHIAVHYGKHGIRCNAICPGALERTPNHDIHPNPTGRKAQLTSDIPLGRLGKPEDIAPFITFLATPAASYANGATFVIDGGLTVA